MKRIFSQYPILAWVTAVVLVGFVLLTIAMSAMGMERYLVFVQPRVSLQMEWFKVLRAPWTLLTYPMGYQLAGAQVVRLVFELLMFWMFGMLLIGTVGERKVRALVLVALFILPILLLAICLPLPIFVPWDSLYGLRLVNYALVASAITLLPGLKVRVFFVLEVPLLWLGLAILFIAWMLGIAFRTHEMFSVPLWAAYGWQYVVQSRKGRDLAGWILRPGMIFDGVRERKERKRKEALLAKARKTFKVVDEPAPAPIRPLTDDESEVDRILDKIGASGYDSLTRAEKEFLDRHSKK